MCVYAMTTIARCQLRMSCVFLQSQASVTRTKSRRLMAMPKLHVLCACCACLVKNNNICSRPICCILIQYIHFNAVCVCVSMIVTEIELTYPSRIVINKNESGRAREFADAIASISSPFLGGWKFSLIIFASHRCDAIRYDTRIQLDSCSSQFTSSVSN